MGGSLGVWFIGREAPFGGPFAVVGERFPIDLTTDPGRAYTRGMTTTNNSTRPELTDVINPATGMQLYASDGAVNQGGTRPIKRCGACGLDVVFVQSSKTGKWYLADCFKGQGGMDFYVKANPHFKTCAERLEWRAEAARREAKTACFDEWDAWFNAEDAAGRPPTREQAKAKIEELKIKHGVSD